MADYSGAYEGMASSVSVNTHKSADQRVDLMQRIVNLEAQRDEAMKRFKEAQAHRSSVEEDLQQALGALHGMLDVEPKRYPADAKLAEYFKP